MKKLVIWIMVMLIAGTTLALAEAPEVTATPAPTLITDLSIYTDEELLTLAELLELELETRGLGIEYETLQKGDNNENVVALQKRLIELNYLSGSADGDFGNKTKSAIELFQTDAGLSVTGIADHETQTLLYSDDAPIAKVYLDLDFKAISRDPDAYEGKNYKFSGKVVQVMEEELEDYTYVVMRIATVGNYDDVVYVSYLRENSESRILEDDRVTVYATCLGLYTYETVIGGSITLPNFLAESVTVN